MHIIFLGAPGAGKGTQSQIASDRYHIPIIGAGNLIRETLKNGSPLGEEIKSYMDSGKLVPDEIVIKIIQDRLALPDAQNGYILDGFPRTVTQAKALETMGVCIEKVIDIDVPDDVIIERVSGRRVCGKCGSSYHIAFNPPKQEGICDRCGGELQFRDDDRAEVISKRLQVYHEQTQPLVEYYSKSGKLYTVDGRKSLEDTTAMSIAALEA